MKNSVIIFLFICCFLCMGQMKPSEKEVYRLFKDTEYFQSEINKIKNFIEFDVDSAAFLARKNFIYSSWVYSITGNKMFYEFKLEFGLYFGVTFAKKLQYSKAVFVYNFIINEAKKSGLSRIESLAYNALGLVYYNNGFFDEARYYFLTSVKIANSTNDKSAIATGLCNLGLILASENRHSDAIKYFKRSLNFMISTRSIKGIIVNHGNIALSYLAIKEYERAEYHINAATKNACEAKILVYEGIGYLNLAKLKNIRGNYNEAIKYAKMGLHIAETISSLDLIAGCYKELSLTYGNINNSDSAYFFLQRYSYYNDTLSFINKEYITDEIASKEKFKNELIQAESKQKLQEEIVKKSYNQKILLIIISLLMLVIIIIISFLFRKRSRLNRLLAEHVNMLNHTNTELKNSELNLKESNKIKDKFIAVLSHDIHNSASSIKTASGLLKNNHLANEELKDELIIGIYEEASKHLELIHSILLWAKLKIGRVEFTPKNIDAGLAILRVKLLIEHLAEKKGIAILNEIPENTFVYADPSMFASIVRNLIINAIKFSPEHSSIVVSAAVLNDEVVFSIADEGVGIPEEYIERLFSSDFDSSQIMNHSSKGSGIGLILCRDLVEINGGRIFAENIPFKGCKFSFTLKIEKNGNEEKN